MVEFFRRDPSCERARTWASLELDGELSQFEGVLLRAHLRSCGSCARAVGELRALTAALRAAPLEQPERPLALPARPQRALALRLAVAATLAALAAGVGLMAGSLSRDEPRTAAPPSTEIAFLERDATQERVSRDPPGLEGRRSKQRLYPHGRRGGAV